MLTDSIELVNDGKVSRRAVASGPSLPGVGSASDLDMFEVIGGESAGVYMFSAALNEWVIQENVDANIYDIGLTVFDRPRSNDIVCKHIAARTFVIDPNFAGSIAKATFASSDQAVFTVQRVTSGAGGSTVNIGTLTFSAGNDTGVFATSGSDAIVFKRGQVLRIVSPEIRDATLSNIDITICGKLFVPR